MNDKWDWGFGGLEPTPLLVWLSGAWRTCTPSVAKRLMVCYEFSSCVSRRFKYVSWGYQVGVTGAEMSMIFLFYGMFLLLSLTFALCFSSNRASQSLRGEESWSARGMVTLGAPTRGGVGGTVRRAHSDLDHGRASNSSSLPPPGPPRRLRHTPTRWVFLITTNKTYHIILTPFNLLILIPRSTSLPFYSLEILRRPNWKFL